MRIILESSNDIYPTQSQALRNLARHMMIHVQSQGHSEQSFLAQTFIQPAGREFALD